MTNRCKEVDGVTSRIHTRWEQHGISQSDIWPVHNSMCVRLDYRILRVFCKQGGFWIKCIHTISCETFRRFRHLVACYPAGRFFACGIQVEDRLATLLDHHANTDVSVACGAGFDDVGPSW
jgi:hypothetical protein